MANLRNMAIPVLVMFRLMDFQDLQTLKTSLSVSGILINLFSWSTVSRLLLEGPLFFSSTPEVSDDGRPLSPPAPNDDWVSPQGTIGWTSADIIHPIAAYCNVL